MGNIQIDPEALLSASQQLNQQGQQLAQIEQQIQKMISGLRWEGESRKPFEAQWEQAIKDFQKLAQEAKQMADFCTTAANSFKQEDDNGFANLLGAIGGFASGFVSGGLDAIVGTAKAALNPVGTLESIGNLATNVLENPGQTFGALAQSFDDNVINGTAESRGHFAGELAGTLFNPIGDVGAATGLKNLAEVGNDINLTSQADHLADVALEPDKHEGLPGLEDILGVFEGKKGEE